MLMKSVKLPKPAQTIKCKFTNDEDQEWRKVNVVSRAGKFIPYLMNVAMVIHSGWILNTVSWNGKQV